MLSSPDLAAIAALIGEPTRATMLVELMGGRALTASELAMRADVAASTASDHLARLVAGGLLTCVAQGRHRYFRLATPGVARTLEALGILARPAPPRDHFEAELFEGIRYARTCYDHLAGRLGVAITDALVDRDVLRANGEDYRVSKAGDTWFAAFGVDASALRRGRRAFARSCLDWTERRPHLAGALGSALLKRLLDLGWFERSEGERALQVTPRGRDGLRAELGLTI